MDSDGEDPTPKESQADNLEIQTHKRPLTDRGRSQNVSEKSDSRVPVELKVSQFEVDQHPQKIEETKENLDLNRVETLQEPIRSSSKRLSGLQSRNSPLGFVGKNQSRPQSARAEG